MKSVQLEIAPCVWCRHLNLAASRRVGRYVCDAYPGGVPLTIARGEERHREGYPGDRGIRFELRDLGTMNDER